MWRHASEEAAWFDESLPWEERVQALRLAMQEWRLSNAVERHYVPVVTYEDAEKELKEMENFHVPENDWRQFKGFVHENTSDIRTLRELFKEHCERSEHMDVLAAEKIDGLSMDVTRILTKLDNGFSKDVALLKESHIDKDDVRQVFTEMLQSNKKRGREWLAAVTAVCTLVITAVALWMGLS